MVALLFSDASQVALIDLNASNYKISLMAMILGYDDDNDSDDNNNNDDDIDDDDADDDDVGKSWQYKGKKRSNPVKNCTSGLLALSFPHINTICNTICCSIRCSSAIESKKGTQRSVHQN